MTAAELAPAGQPVQGSLFAAPPSKSQRVLAAMDAIVDRHGEGALRHGLERRDGSPWGPGL